MSKFTPGPWNWVSDYPPDGENRGPIDMASFKSRGYYGNPELDGANGRPVLACGEYDILRGVTKEENLANARLIAAAPDLLRSLMWLADAAETEPGMAIYREHIQLARETIKKATQEG